MAQQYFYDKQIRRYIQQFIRLFGGFNVQMGVDDDKMPIMLEVPVRYGDINRMAAHIQRENSENITNTVPFISCYVTDFSMAPERRNSQTHVEKMQIFEKAQREDGTYIDDQVGNTYTVERYMPVPYNLTMNCDIWTSNTDQKLQLLEQIMVLFNPTLDVRTSDNIVDWSALTYVEMTNSIWSSRSIGNSVDDIIDVATLTFQLPALINPPAKVKHQRLIHTMLGQLYNLDDDNLDLFRENSPFDKSTVEYVVVTLEDRKLKFEDGKVYVLTSSASNLDADGNPLNWKEILLPFGELREGISQMRLTKSSNSPGDTTGDIIGRLSIDDNDPTALLIDIDTDTLPTNTLSPVNAFVNPQINLPGVGNVPAAQQGQRYLLTADTTDQWNVTAKQNDIIEYNGSSWIVSFDSQANNSTQYVTNLTTSKQFLWNNNEWINSYEGIYNEGYWRLYL